jgi:cytochrome P450
MYVAFIRLANIELQLCLSYLFSRFTLELFETDSTSIEWRDTVSASNLKPIRVSVLEELWEC